ncbi:hypothetical protein [Corynebacterium glutamicum]|uniref:Uncharacterized protein n=1 Tax=Corynebacterium glutamicum (strain R) TaxID=340322 RepID=A0AB72V8B0_CORGB|nr:hypothetical protein [Corynebacterium glutamicum]BAF53446.1 hypothetical protein cgR_0482 [Corynebacterium glutamicum R]
MSEEKLTVAELMARAAKEGRSADAPRRRRRRSIEDGGVSVAELTGSIPAVKEKPAESKHSSVPIDAPAEPEVVEAPKTEPAEEVEVASVEGDVDKQETPERPAPSNEETMVLRIVDEKDPISLTTGAFPVVPAVAAKPAPVVRAEKDADVETAVKADFAEVEVDNTDTTQMAVVEEVDEEPEQENKMSVFAIIMMAIVGVVLGVVVFLGFEMLWERLNKWIVAVLAVGVTLGMVGIIHALRTSRDGFSMVLAGIVGLVMTFGPLAIVM